VAHFPSTQRPDCEADFSPPSSSTVMKAWSFSSVYSCIRLEQLYCCYSNSLLFLYLNMLSAARRAEVELLGYWLNGSGFQFRYGQLISSPKRLSVCAGCYLDVKRLKGETQNSPPSIAILRMCGAVPPHPLHAFVTCIWTMRVEIRKSKWQDDREICKMWKLKRSFAIVAITINIVGRASRMSGWRADCCGG